ncbi:MAG: arsenate reductase ArsC [Kiritimatiellae bacterium]|nr:arsenate reductase ArsC [Kiritimatiellia bacterium]
MKEKVLFLCTGNSARSQMGEALLRKHVGHRFDVFSAGTEPKPIHPLTLRVLDEKGINTARLVSKGLDELITEGKFTHVIVVCDHANRTCPATLPGMKERIFWPFEDPVAFKGPPDQQLAKFRQVRDQIEARIKEWLTRLDGDQTAAQPGPPAVATPPAQAAHDAPAALTARSASPAAPRVTPATPPKPPSKSKLQIEDLEPPGAESF